MTDNPEHELNTLQAEIRRTRKTLAALEKRAESYGDVQAESDVKPKSSAYGQQGQHVKAQYNIAGNVYNGPAPENDEEALKIYRKVLARTCANVSMVFYCRKDGQRESRICR